MGKATEALAPDPTLEAARDQTWSAEGYEKNARFVSALGGEILKWLAPQPGERIIDLGCGDGKLSQKIAEAGADVVGVDISNELLAIAKADGLDVRLMDAEALEFADEFDAVFSNAALHWMPRPDLVLAGIAKALKPGGRFVAEFGGHGNMAAVISVLRALAKTHGLDANLAGPWFFPSAADYGARLERAGFKVERIALVPRPTPLPTGLAGWLTTFAKLFLDQVDAERQQQLIAEAEELLRPSLCDEKGVWSADYVRLRAAATWQG